MISRKRLGAIVQAPSGSGGATVHVDGANDVQIRGFTIHGTPGILAAIFVGGDDADGGSAEISHNHIAVRDGTPLTGAQGGVGVLVERTGRVAEFSDDVASATIEHNLIDDYQKAGIVINGEGSSAEIAHNEVVGTIAEHPQAAQIGIQISSGADAAIHHNVVANTAYTPNPDGTQWAASGILVFGAGDVEIAHNTVSGGDSEADNNVGIYVYQTDGAEISHNKLRNNDYGILLLDLEDALVEHNDIRDSDVVGLALYQVMNSDLLFNRGKGNGLDFSDDNEGENNWHKNKGDLSFA